MNGMTLVPRKCACIVITGRNLKADVCLMFIYYSWQLNHLQPFEESTHVCMPFYVRLAWMGRDKSLLGSSDSVFLLYRVGNSRTRHLKPDRIICRVLG